MLFTIADRESGKPGLDFFLSVEDGFQRLDRQELVSKVQDLREYLRVGDLSAHGEGLLLFLIHGYNTSREEARQWFSGLYQSLREEFNLRNLVVFGYEWGSLGRVEGYLEDWFQAERAGLELSSALLELVSYTDHPSCTARVCVVAHSMGNRVLASAARLAHERLGRPAAHSVFSEVLMVAADLDAEDLEEGRAASKVPPLARRVTNYHNRGDRVLMASAAKRAGVRGPRLGRTGPAGHDLPPNVVSVDVTNAAKDADSQHSACFQRHEILADIVCVLRGYDREMIDNRVGKGGNRFEIKDANGREV